MQSKMEFAWTAPNLKNNTPPSNTAPARAVITYTMDVWDDKGKKFAGTTVTTGALTTNAISGVTAGQTIAVQQVITVANDNVIESAVKTLKVK